MPVGRVCCLAHRCRSIECASCGWRYSLSVARRILACEPRSLRAVTIRLSASGPLEFLHERKSLHNLFGHRRRQSRWWRSIGLWGWWDGLDLRGIVSLGSVTTTEFTVALRRHGNVRLRPIAIETVRTEVYRAAQSVSTSQHSHAAGRYQRLKIAIEPVTARVRSSSMIESMMVEAMPILI